MGPLTRARTNVGQWALIGVLSIVLVFAPSVVATTVTAPGEPVDFLRRPWSGWAFTSVVLRESVRADAASPGEALELAQRRWDGEERRPLATRVQLLYLPGDTSYELRRGREVDPPRSLAWLVLGRAAPTASEREIGMLDFSTGEFLEDTVEQDARADAPRRAGAPTATAKEAA